MRHVGPGTNVIDSRFNGPPGSANGGYACGSAADLAGIRPAVVTLVAPPPMEAPLTVAAGEDGAEVSGPDGVFARVAAADHPIETISPITIAEVTSASESFDVDLYRDNHIFPTCFTCGPDREPHDGLCIYPAPIEDREGVVAWQWMPHASTGGDDGRVDERILWAALDCPSGLSWMESEGQPAVLGRMATDMIRRPAVGESLVVAGWRTDAKGRRRNAGSAIWDTDGNIVAASSSTWVILDEAQAAVFAKS